MFVALVWVYSIGVGVVCGGVSVVLGSAWL